MRGQTNFTPGRENVFSDPLAFYLGAGRYSENSYKRANVARAREHDRDSRMPLALRWKSIDGFDMDRFETDYGLRWDHERQVWTASDGFAYNGSESSAEAGTHDAA